MPGMLYGKILRSPYPHANIIDIDTTGAETLPGVEAVVTYKNAPDWQPGNPKTVARPGTEGPFCRGRSRPRRCGNRRDR